MGWVKSHLMSPWTPVSKPRLSFLLWMDMNLQTPSNGSKCLRNTAHCNMLDNLPRHLPLVYWGTNGNKKTTKIVTVHIFGWDVQVFKDVQMGVNNCHIRILLSVLANCKFCTLRELKIASDVVCILPLLNWRGSQPKHHPVARFARPRQQLLL